MRNISFIIFITFLFSSCCFYPHRFIKPSIVTDPSHIAAFNTLHLGWGHKNFSILASALTNFDLIGLSEVMNKKGLLKLEKTLEQKSGEEWNSLISAAVGETDDYREHYAFLWKKSRVHILATNGFYPVKNTFARPPFAATFKFGKFDATIVICHIRYGHSKKTRTKEISRLPAVYTYFQTINGSEQDVIIGGDFNLSAKDIAFHKLLQTDNFFYTIPTFVKTTLGTKGFSSSYDNIFLNKYTIEYTGRSGISDFTRGRFSWMRKKVSDHVPIYIEVNRNMDDDH